MRYNWDLMELETNRIILEDVYKNFDDENIKYNIQVSIALYKIMLKLFNKNGKGIEAFDDNYTDIDINKIIDDLLYSYNCNNFEYIYLLLNSFFAIKDYSFDYDDISNNIKINNDQLIDITADFFEKMTTPTISKKFYDILNQGNRIKINYENTYSEYAGFTINDDILNKKYIYISRKNKLLDLILLPHESFHYIFGGNNTGITSYYNTKYLNEVEGLFANILFADYANNIVGNGKKIFKNHSNYLYQEHIEDLVIRNTLLQSITEDKKIRFHKFNKFLQSICPNSEDFTNIDELSGHLETPQEVTINYSFSYLVAIDLYYQYLKDREEAFYSLESIKYNKRTNQIINLLENNGITFMKDNYENLKKYIKK